MGMPVSRSGHSPRRRTHPGDIIRDELAEISMSPHALSMALGVPASRIDQIVKCRRSVTPDTALRLARYFGGEPTFWLTMQMHHDLSVAEEQAGEHIRRSVEARPPKYGSPKML